MKEAVQKVINRCHSEEERRRNLLIINSKRLTALSLHFVLRFLHFVWNDVFKPFWSASLFWILTEIIEVDTPCCTITNELICLLLNVHSFNAGDLLETTQV